MHLQRSVQAKITNHFFHADDGRAMQPQIRWPARDKDQAPTSEAQFQPPGTDAPTGQQKHHWATPEGQR
eukprot:1541812-Heterocapsa_arctica.AAC.1